MGPMTSKYCFEKNAFKSLAIILQYFFVRSPPIMRMRAPYRGHIAV